MKIIRQSRTDYTKEELRRIQANKGCNICPNCGETKPFHMTKKGKFKGVQKALYTTINYGLFTKYGQRDNYECYTCGCKWQSDLY